jgi:hypothetical protein
MLYREIIPVCSQIHTKHINTLCGLNVELLNVKHGGTYSNQLALKGRNQKKYEWPSYSKKGIKYKRPNLILLPSCVCQYLHIFRLLDRPRM